MHISIDIGMFLINIYFFAMIPFEILDFLYVHHTLPEKERIFIQLLADDYLLPRHHKKEQF